MSDPAASTSLPWPFVKRDHRNYELHYGHLIEFLREHGYGKAYADSPMNSTLVRVEDGIVRRTSPERVKDFVMGKIRNPPDEEIPESHNLVDIVGDLVSGSSLDFSEKRLRYMPELDLDFKEDRPGDAFFYYENGFVRVTEEGYELRPYEDLDGKIWDGQVVGRSFEKIEDTGALASSDWFKFLSRVMGGNEDRMRALWSALGYLLHGFKDPDVGKAVIFVDEALSEDPSGRTGKSLVAESLRKIVPGHREDARNFTFDTRFAFQFIRPEMQVVDFNDASKDLIKSYFLCKRRSARSSN